MFQPGLISQLDQIPIECTGTDVYSMRALTLYLQADME